MNRLHRLNGLFGTGTFSLEGWQNYGGVSDTNTPIGGGKWSLKLSGGCVSAYCTQPIVGIQYGDVYELKTTAFNPNDKNNFLMGQRFMGAFKTLEQAKTAAKMLYDAESYIRETAVY